MRRREFISLLGSGALAWPLTAQAQQQGKLPTIGLLGANAVVWAPWANAFVARLRQLGWIEGQTIRIEYRWNDGQRERIAQIAAEFVQLKVNAIVTAGGEAAIVKRVTSDIPIVFAQAVDPVGDGLVESLSRPGGNVTGLSVQAADLPGKQLQLLRETVPHLRQLGLMGNAGYAGAVQVMHKVEAAASDLNLEVIPIAIRKADDIALAVEDLKEKADALYVVSDALVAANRVRLISLTLGAHLPTFFVNTEYVRAGGLMSYGANVQAMFRRAADFVDKILRGTKPADIPVEQPTEFELILNLTTAKAIGLTIPASLKSKADEVIE